MKSSGYSRPPVEHVQRPKPTAAPPRPSLPEKLPFEIATVLGQYRFSFTCEDDLQIAIAAALTASSIPFQREYVLGPADRLDFLIGTTAIEVKIKGSLNDLTRQVHRYLQHPKINSVVVVTTRSGHRSLPREMNGKSVFVLYLPQL
jgi:hypothetical protein